MSEENGQAVLMIVLVMAVVGVVTLAVADNTVKGLRVQQIGNESISAFKGAESALEKSLQTRLPVSNTEQNVTYEATFNTVGQNGFMTGDAVDPGNIVQVLTYDGTVRTGGLNIYFQTGAALKVADFWGDSPNTGVTYYTFDPDNSRNIANHFNDGGGCLGGPFTVTKEDGSFNFDCRRQILSLNPNTKLVRILVLYGSSRVGVEPSSGGMPKQKDIVNARGSVNKNQPSNTTYSEVTRQISYTQLGKRLPSIFDSVLYTNNNLIQN